MKALIPLFCFLSSVTLISAQNTDFRILNKANVHRDQRWDPTMNVVTHSAMPLTVSVPLLFTGVAFLNRDTLKVRKGLVMATGLGTNVVFTLALKYSIQRQRPYLTYPQLDPIHSESTPSFPSGHSSNAFVTATALTLALPKWYVAAAAYTWASAVAYSRLHRGVHYPTDVFCGALLGSGSALLTHLVNKKLQKRKP